MTDQAHDHRQSKSPASGKVYLVGAGPGAAELITLRALHVLGRADVVLYDYLVNPRILRYARSGAELISLGQHGATRIWSQHEINEQMVALAQAGKTVVRLKGGDPAVFGRLADELDYLCEHGVAFEVVPGVTAASAMSAYAGIVLTERDAASAVALVTGQLSDQAPHERLDYRALAAFPGTLVFYMGVTTAHRWVPALIAAGKDPKTPAALVRRCSLPNQLVIRCALKEIPDQIRSRRLRPPALVVIGSVVTASDRRSWFEHLPLAGRSVLVTRPEGQAEELLWPLSELGADVLVQPAIRIEPPESWEPVDQAIARIGDFAWIVFSSSNGVQFFLNRLRDLGRDWRALGPCRLAAVGPGTARALAAYGLLCDLQPPRFTADDLARALKHLAMGQRVLLVRASRGRDVLREELAGVAAEVVQVVAYRSLDVERPDAQIARRLAEGRVDWVTVTSSAIARSLATLFGTDLAKAKLASISPITSGVLRQLGFEPAVEATAATMPSLIDAIVRFETTRSSDA
ncbi:MAG: uroporphyrinogen III methyltransferase [Pirellulaceae bacterium]|nr:MAG: uroporphyrinogen III methyltransferase [Pirellulaceae bacterium]